MTEQRHFRVVAVSGGIPFEEDGRYAGSKPQAAAAKAANQIIRSTPSVKQFEITVQETTRGSKKPSFSYLVKTALLAEPREVRRGDAIVTYSRETRLSKIRGE